MIFLGASEAIKYHICSAGASPSRQPGHFQVTKVVRQVTLPFSSPLFVSLPLTPFPFPPLFLLSLRSKAFKIQRCTLPSGVWGGAPAEIDFGAF